MTKSNKVQVLELLKSYKRIILGGYNLESVDIDLLNARILEMGQDLNYFKITSVHRADLLHSGVCITDVTDDLMELLARKMSDDYCEQMFHTSLSIIAEDGLNIPTGLSLRDRIVAIAHDRYADPETTPRELGDLYRAKEVLKSLDLDTEYDLTEIHTAVCIVRASLESLTDLNVIVEFDNISRLFTEFLKDKALLQWNQ